MNVVGFIMSLLSAAVAVTAFVMGDMQSAYCALWLAAGAVVPVVFGFVFSK